MSAALSAAPWALRGDPAEMFPREVPMPSVQVDDRGERCELRWSSAWRAPGADAARFHLAGGGEARASWRWSDDARATVVCVSGYCMGWPGLDALALDARGLRAAGVDPVLYTAPLQGARLPRGSAGLPWWPSADLGTTRAAVLTAVHEVRELVAWLRRETPGPVGVMGLSLGAWVAALAATTDCEMDFLVALTPLADLGHFVRDHCPAPLRWNATRMAEALDDLSPFARAPSLARDRTLVLAASHDRVTAADVHAERLAAHFGGELVRYEGAHLVPWGRRAGYGAIGALVDRALAG